ncbi:MAG: sulfatase-like hydrolase/transferase [Halobacteriovoraceae bacterium]|nr:sulfatase-like hydrolase/transferase [Halobacteriovoraceae bacterium]
MNSLNKNKTLILFYFINIFSYTLFSSVFRLIQYASYSQRIDFKFNFDFLLSFIIGFQFDFVTVTYIITLPFLLLFLEKVISQLFHIQAALLSKISLYIYFFLFQLVILVHLFDLFYFDYFFERLNIAVFSWIDSPAISLGMIIQDKFYLLSSFVSSIIIGIEIYLFYKLSQKFLNWYQKKNSGNIFITLLIFVIFLFSTFVGFRGRFKAKSPLRIGTAFFSDNTLINKVTLNPAFTLIKSYLQSRKRVHKNMMDPTRALQIFDQHFKRENMAHFEENLPGPGKPNLKNYNVVIVIMESMTASYMKYFGETRTLMPVLDDLALKSIFFEQAYTEGIHTFNGIYSTIFSRPALLTEHPMKKYPIPHLQNISEELKKYDYVTSYYTNHDAQFDNVEGFMTHNGFDHIFDDDQYPKEKIISSFGVADHDLFEFGVKKITELSQTTKKPLLSIFMNASNHSPLILPQGIDFKPHNEEIDLQLFEYADWSIGHFLNLAKKEKWFSKTLFVFVADHGKSLKPYFPIVLSYHHSPLIFYWEGVTPEVKKQMASQMDIFPSVMSLLGLSWTNKTFGIDLFEETREYALVNNDQHFALLGNDLLFVLDQSLKPYAYHYKENTHNIIEKLENSKSLESLLKAQMTLRMPIK